MVAAVQPGISRATIPRWAAPFLYPARYKSAAGGRGAGRTHTFSELCVLRMDRARGLSPRGRGNRVGLTLNNVKHRSIPVRVSERQLFAFLLRLTASVGLGLPVGSRGMGMP